MQGQRLYNRIVCLSPCEEDYAKSSRAMFMKRSWIMDCCCGKNPLTFRLDFTQTDQIAAMIMMMIMMMKFPILLCAEKLEN